MNETTNQYSSEEDVKYSIHIDNFDGPLDLLWELIKKSKIEITEVSISEITEQYIQYLKLMKQLNVKVATDFIRMASELLYYKSRALLPSGQIEDEYFVPPLPPELVQKLLEYKKYQMASIKLQEEFDRMSNKFPRNNNLEQIIDLEEYIDVSLFDLLKAFAEVIESQRSIEQDEIVFDEILVSDRIKHINELLMHNDIILFQDAFSKKPTRMEIVATFLAILELARTKIIKIMQHKVFGNIRIARNAVRNDSA